MTEMVERVARSMWAERRRDAMEHGIYLEEWDEGAPATGAVANNIMGEARAAIEAMREPTLAMRKVSTFEVAEGDWPAMIDAALKP